MPNDEMHVVFLKPNGLLTHKLKSRHRLALIAINSCYLFNLMLYVPVNSYGDVKMIAVKAINETNKQEFIFAIICTST